MTHEQNEETNSYSSPTKMTPSTLGIPVIDMKGERDDVVQQISQACEEIGFFTVINHGIDRQIVDAALLASKDFFDLDQTTKDSWTSENAAEYPYGYERSENLALAKTGKRSLDDLKETFSIGPYSAASGAPPRRFPGQPSSMQSALEDYYVATEGLALRLAEILALALDLEANWFVDKMSRHESALKILNYPNLTEPPAPGQLRAGEHTDYGAFTILKSGGPGLQVRKDLPGTEQGEWIDVPDLDDAFIINLGDMMQRWTNGKNLSVSCINESASVLTQNWLDKWVSTLHRVAVPPFDGVDRRRQSIAFLVCVKGDTEVLPIHTCVDEGNPAKYGEVAAGKYLMRKYLESMGLEHD